jgi:HlyD family secretion protein
MKLTLKSTLAYAAVIVLAGAGLFSAYRPTPVRCDIEAVSRGPLLVTVDEDGKTRLKDRYIISAPISARLERITLKPGDSVVAPATILARLTAVQPHLLDERARAEAAAKVKASEAAVSRGEFELARAEAELAHIRTEYERVRTAAAAKAVSAQELDDELVLLRTAEHAKDAARFSVQMALFELEQAKAALHFGGGSENNSDTPPNTPFEIPSPITGKVLRVLRENAGVVNMGDPLLELGSLEHLEIEIDVLSDQAVRVKPGASVTLERWGGDRPLAGVVRVVEPSGYMKVSALGVEEQRVNVIIDFVDPPEARATLGDNFRVEAKIAVWETADAIRVPLGALFRHQDSWAVFLARDGRAVRQPITIGERSTQFAQVLQGLAAGDRVIVFPSDKVADGGRITPRSQGR